AETDHDFAVVRDRNRECRGCGGHVEWVAVVDRDEDVVPWIRRNDARIDPRQEVACGKVHSRNSAIVENSTRGEISSTAVAKYGLTIRTDHPSFAGAIGDLTVHAA